MGKVVNFPTQVEHRVTLTPIYFGICEMCGQEAAAVSLAVTGVECVDTWPKTCQICPQDSTVFELHIGARCIVRVFEPVLARSGVVERLRELLTP